MKKQDTSAAAISLQKTYRPLNLLLATTLAFLTCKKIYAVIMLGSLHPMVLVALIVPAVNIYILYLILGCERSGYQYLFILTVLALVHPENRHFIELVLNLVLIVFSGLLYYRLYPKSAAVKINA